MRGVVHLAQGEGQKGFDCMSNGTKAVGVIAATAEASVATAGLSNVAAAACVGGAAAGAQMSLDAADTGVRSAWAGIPKQLRVPI